jgi:hypothetical protein
MEAFMAGAYPTCRCKTEYQYSMSDAERAWGKLVARYKTVWPDGYTGRAATYL